MDYENYLKEKRKDELITICRSLNIQGYSKLSKNRLKEIILEHKGKKDFKKHLGIQKPWFLTSKIIPFLAIVLSSVFFVYNKNNAESSKNLIINNQNKNKEELLEIIKPSSENYELPLSNEEYSDLIEKYESLNNILLKDFYGEDFQVFGQKNNHLFKNARTFQSTIKIENKKIKLYVNLEEFSLGDKVTDITFSDTVFSREIPGGKLEIGQRFIIPFFNFNGRQFFITILDNDVNHPIYALGFNKTKRSN